MSAGSTTARMFAPKYIENKLKFYPNIQEAVAFGDKRDFVCVMLNIDLTAVSSWAERNNVVYALLSGARQPPAGLRRWCRSMSKR